MNPNDAGARARLLQRMLGRKSEASASPVPAPAASEDRRDPLTSFEHHPAYERMRVTRAVAAKLGLANPYFLPHEGVGGATTTIDGRHLINFSSANYLGLCGHPEVDRAAKAAIDRYGTSTSASRLGGGERPIQRELERALAQLHQVEDCIVYVSAHAGNISTLAALFGPRDLIVHDSLIHNSVLEGIVHAGSARRAFAHNDLGALDALLGEVRGRFERVLIVVEGLYGMDGDVPDLPELLRLKRRHRALLMVDEAHAIGVLGERGGGLREHFGVDGREVDLWMGSFSKTLAGCGGYIAGTRALVELLKYQAPGFVFSVGIAPPLAAAALEALRTMQREPERVARLRRLGRYFLARAQAAGIDTGTAQGHAVLPALVGNSLQAAVLSNRLFERGINVQPVTYPAVGENAARLRFFLCCTHEEAQLDATIDALAEAMREGPARAAAAPA
jgi:8-amino-7-oxononanoate synthase